MAAEKWLLAKKLYNIEFSIYNYNFFLPTQQKFIKGNRKQKIVPSVLT